MDSKYHINLNGLQKRMSAKQTQTCFPLMIFLIALVDIVLAILVGLLGYFSYLDVYHTLPLLEQEVLEEFPIFCENITLGPYDGDDISTNISSVFIDKNGKYICKFKGDDIKNPLQKANRMSLAQFRARGRAYQCRKCGKVDRKGRMTGHILKHHVPFDRVPFSCSLCLFRCQDRQALLDHIKKYSRHREEELRTGKPDYAKILKKSGNPYNVEDDCIQLTKDQSLRWFARNSLPENPLDDDDTLFDDDDDDDVVVSGGLSLPRWLVGPNVSVSSACIPSYKKPQTCTTTHQIQNNQQYMTLTNSALQPSLIPNLHVPETQVNKNQLPQLETIDFGSLLNDNSTLTTGRLETPSLVNTLNTPCLDERGPIYLEDLLLGDAEKDDPLLRGETNKDEPPQKKHKATSTSPLPQANIQNLNYGDIVKAVQDGTKLIAEAINSNTKAIKCNEKALDRVTVELSRIERKVHNMERSFHQQQEKENKVPPRKQPLKSVVTKP